MMLRGAWLARSRVCCFGAPRGAARTLAMARKAKKGSKMASQQKEAEGEMRDSNYQLYVDIIDAPKKVRPKLTEAQWERDFAIGREYNIKVRRQHDDFEAQLQLKLDLQQFAVECLPSGMRAKSQSLEDHAPPPLDRRFWTWTPPIPGFKPEDHAVPM